MEIIIFIQRFQSTNTTRVVSVESWYAQRAGLQKACVTTTTRSFANSGKFVNSQEHDSGNTSLNI